MNRPSPLDVENELLAAAEAHPGQGLALGADGIARPVADQDWAVLGPKLAQALLDALPVVEDALGDAKRAVRLTEGLGDNDGEIRVREVLQAQAAHIRTLLAESGVVLPQS